MMMMMMTRRVVRGSGIQGRTLPRLEDIALWGVIVFFLLHFFIFLHLTHPNIVVRPVMMMRMRKSEVHIQELGRVGSPWGRFSHFDEKTSIDLLEQCSESKPDIVTGDIEELGLETGQRVRRVGVHLGLYQG